MFPLMFLYSGTFRTALGELSRGYGYLVSGLKDCKIGKGLTLDLRQVFDGDTSILLRSRSTRYPFVLSMERRAYRMLNIDTSHLVTFTIFEGEAGSLLYVLSCGLLRHPTVERVLGL